MKKTLLIAASALALASAAQARPGWYVGLEGGWSAVDDFVVSKEVATQVRIESLTIGGQYGKSYEVSPANGYALFGTAGYAFKNGIRLEAEVGYRYSGNDTVTYFDKCEEEFLTVKSPGGLEEITGMVNVLYDVKLNRRFKFSLGGGAGVDHASLKGPFGGKDSDTVFAAQAIGGVSYAVSENLDLVLNYRYLWVNSPDFSGTNIPWQVAKEPLASLDRKDDLEKQAVTFGFRYAFPAEKPAPVVEMPAPPTPTPTPASFIIFFGFNKCDITPAADQVLSEAASAAKTNGSASISIVGHTDTSGSAAYNDKLSLCRAHAAEANLVGKGIAGQSISVSGAGENQLLIKTDDGVKEPQNRRATIDLH